MSTAIYNEEGWIKEPEELDMPEDGWDTSKLVEVVNAADRATAIAMFTKGQASANFSGLYLARLNVKPLVCGVPFFECAQDYKGVHGDKPHKFGAGTTGERNTYENTTIDGVGPFKWDVSEPKGTITDKWVSLAAPDMNIIGTAQAPPLDLGTPIDIWYASTDVVRSYPHGWVLDKREVDNIPGTTVWLVNDTYVYYQVWRPSK